MSERMEVYTVREVAAHMRVSEATVRRLILYGKLPATRIGRSIRINARVLDHMLAKEPRDAR